MFAVKSLPPRPRRPSVTGSSSTVSGVFAGRYTIERELGRGATSIVYLARRDSDGQSVAIKVLRAELVTEISTERFLREIRVTTRLQHPNIVPVLDSGEYDDRLFFVLPHMEGGTLRARLEREKQLPIGDVIAIGKTIAGALHFAHERQLLHRDVKPENILFSGGEARLADFGIARALSASSASGSAASTTSTGVVRGTPAYMSPEQAAGDHNIDARSDVYSLACVLYEAVAGVAAFVGPTPQSVLSQRLSHVPRGVRVYRPTAPIELERVLERALALAPVDRYQTAAEFLAALSATNTDILAYVDQPARHVASRRRLVLAVATVVVTLAVALALFPPYELVRTTPAAPDTTMLAVLPLDGTDSAQASQSGAMLQDALAQWRGITVVDHYQVADAHRRIGNIRTARDAASMALSLGAGRYVRGSVSRTANTWRTAVSLYDALSGRELHYVVEEVPNDLAGARLAYTRLASDLLLRGAGGDSIESRSPESFVLPAVQAFSRAQRALDEWNLAGADSALESAIGYDTDYARAGLWLAQVRAWRDLPPSLWGTVAERAIAASAGLSERERRLGQALVALSHAQFQAACETYDSMRRYHDADFAAWFGLGQCRTMDRIVIADSTSPSGWRYRSNYAIALAAYTRAFELLPTVHRGYERGAFERLRLLLLTSRTARAGYGVTDSAMYYARPAWLNNALALVPYPWQRVFSGDPGAIPPGFEQAIRHQRDEFRKVAAGWSAAFPRSADAKYAVALSLQLLGDRASIDTIRLARRLTSDESKQLMFAAAEVSLLLTLGAPDRLDDLRTARSLADSLLQRSTGLTTPDRHVLGPVAALAGKCQEVDRAARAPVPLEAPFRFSPSLWVEAQSALARVALGCKSQSHPNELRSVSDAIIRDYGQGDAQVLRRVNEMLLSRSALLADSPDSLILARLSVPGGERRLDAAAALSRHDRVAARTSLEAVLARWQPSLGVPTPDVLLPESRLWLSLGDTTEATHRLDLTLTNARLYDPEDLAESANIAAFIRAMALRAEIAAATGDATGARRWGVAVVTLWANADADLQPLVKRMSRYAGLR